MHYGKGFPTDEKGNSGANSTDNRAAIHKLRSLESHGPPSVYIISRWRSCRGKTNRPSQGKCRLRLGKDLLDQT